MDDGREACIAEHIIEVLNRSRTLMRFLHQRQDWLVLFKGGSVKDEGSGLIIKLTTGENS